jgi:Ca-activated chloride channel family protein
MTPISSHPVGRVRTTCETLPKRFLARAMRVAAYATVSSVLAIAVVAQNPPPSSPVGAGEEPQQSPPPRATQTPSIQQDSSPQQSSPQPSSPPQSSPQQSEPEPGQFVFKKKVEEVVLRGVVVDQENNLVSNLSEDAFSIYEDGKLQKMTSFHQENAPLALGILIDNSGSMLPKRQKVNDAALNLVRSSNAQDEVFVVNFGEEYYLDQDFTSDVAKLKTALDRVETRGSTALYDAIVASAKHIRQDSKIQKRVLLVVTDGRDNASEESLEEAVRELQRRDGPVVYMIGFLDQTKQTGATMRALQTIASNTGGAAYFPRNLAEVDTITRSIAFDIRNQYVIGYKSSNPSEGHAFHTIDVQAHDSGRRKLRVRTRTGYYSESPAGAL